MVMKTRHGLNPCPGEECEQILYVEAFYGTSPTHKDSCTHVTECTKIVADPTGETDPFEQRQTRASGAHPAIVLLIQ